MKTKIGYFLLLLIMIFSIAAAPLTVYAEDGGGAVRPPADDSVVDTVGGFIHGEALIEADSYEQALGYANAYGVKLKSYDCGIAVLIVDNAEQAVARSANMRMASLPKLSLNRLYSIYDDTADLKLKEADKSSNTYSSSEMRYKYYKDSISEANIPPYTYLSSGLANIDRKTYWEDYAVQRNAAQWHHAEMDNERAWTVSTGRGVVVAVIDTGIDINHPKFAGRISQKSYNPYTSEIGIEFVQDDHGHGTHVSGIVAASMPVGAGVCGVAPDAEILTIKANIPGNPDSFDMAALLRGINYAVENGADIINMSLGRHYLDGPDEIEQRVIAEAIENGVTIVCAAGNESYQHAGYPAAYPETIAVSATDPNGYFDSDYSNFGPEIDISAPGTEIYSTSKGGGYEYLSGTSMASPNVAGTAALIKAIHPEYGHEQIRAVLCGTARKAEYMLNKNLRYGYGIVNSYAALQTNMLYKVTFDLNYAGRGPIVMYAVPGSAMAEPDMPARDGYIFDGWYTSASGGKLYDFNSTINGNLTIFARWIKIASGMYAYAFPDINFRHEVLSILNDLDGGKRLSSSTITANDFSIMAGIDFLYLEWMDIKELKGIEYFTGVKFIYCGGNMLTELDLSKNTALRILDCYANYLTDLDLRNNSALRLLNCDQNQLTELDVSNNKALEVLQCSQMNLQSLDVSKNINLKILYCFMNAKMTALDVSKNTLLTELVCEFNSLKKLDVSKNTELTILAYSGNLLTTVDVSKNTKLKELWGNYNFMKGMDVSKNTALTQLVYFENYMKSPNDINGWRSNPKLVLDNTFLFYPQLDGEPPSGKDITASFKDANFLADVRKVIDKPTGPIYDYEVAKIFSLDVRNRNIRDFSGIEYFVILKELYCGGNNLTQLDLSKNASLIFLSCDNNQLNMLDVSKNTALTYLICAGNKLTKLDVSKNTELEYLDCGDNLISTLDVSKNTHLIYLICNFNNLTKLDVSKNTALLFLNIGYNQLAAINVSNNTALDTLFCNDNKISSLNISKNKRLIYLECQNNKIASTDRVIVWHDLFSEPDNDYFIFYPQNADSFVLGDVNDDGVITTADAVMVLQHIAKIIALDDNEFRAADVNQDNLITTADAVMVLQYIAKIIPSFT